MGNRYYPHGSVSEQNLYDRLIIESLDTKGEDFFYIPRVLVAKDDILTEDVLSKFVGSYPIVGYIDEVDHWGGASSFMSKFGIYQEEQATITISKTKWDELVGVNQVTIVPDRPCEGDLLYLPVTKSLLEIRYVEHQSQFYQLHKQFVYKLKVELFSHSSERFETGITDVDNKAMEMTFDILERGFEQESGLGDIVLEDGGIMITEDPKHRNFNQKSEFIDESNKFLDFDESNPFGEFDR